MIASSVLRPSCEILQIPPALLNSFSGGTESAWFIFRAEICGGALNSHLHNHSPEPGCGKCGLCLPLPAGG